MGQAKNRGSFEQRKAQSIENQKEQDRLDAWLKSRRLPRKCRFSRFVLMTAVIASNYQM